MRSDASADGVDGVMFAAPRREPGHFQRSKALGGKEKPCYYNDKESPIDPSARLEYYDEPQPVR